MDDTNNMQRDKHDSWAIDREHLKKLAACDPREKISETRYSFVADELLESLCCVQLENIEVDIDYTDCASAKTYFQPSRPIDDQLKQRLSQEWFEFPPGQARRLYPEYKAAWFTKPWDETDERKDDEKEIDRFGGSAWRGLEYVLTTSFFKATMIPLEEKY